MHTTFIKQTKEQTFILSVYCQPNGKKNAVVGVYQDALRIKIHAPAVDGKANEALIKFLAEIFSCKKSQLTILSGEKSQHKKIEIHDVSLEKINSFIQKHSAP